jgi:hypothetical protein
MNNLNSEVDVNVLVGIYNQRLSMISNQNILLEAKLQTLKQDYSTLQEEYNALLNSNKTEEK